MDLPTPTLISTMQQAALQAASIAVGERAKPVKSVSPAQLSDPALRKEFFLIAQKPDGSSVTGADMAAQEIIKQELQKIPEQEYHRRAMGIPPFVGEEQGKAEENSTSSGPHWIVDPVDGTGNFVSRKGRWAVSIALQDQNISRAAAVYVADSSQDDAVNGTLFWAEKGQGAFRQKVKNGQLAGEAKPVDFVPAAYVRPGVERKFAKPMHLGYFTEDLEGGRYQGRVNPEGEVRMAVERAMRSRIFNPVLRPEPVTSACAEALEVAEGKSAAYAHGLHFPWDGAGIFLILSEGKFPLREYQSATDPGKSVLLAAAGDVLLRQMDDAYKGASLSIAPSANMQSIASLTPPPALAARPL